MVRKKRVARAAPSLLADLSVIGMEAIEPVILAVLITDEPLLLIEPHGTAKSYLLNRISIALGRRQRHYNVSLLNFDDPVGNLQGLGRRLLEPWGHDLSNPWETIVSSRMRSSGCGQLADSGQNITGLSRSLHWWSPCRVGQIAAAKSLTGDTYAK